MMYFCWGVNFFIGNILGDENKNFQKKKLNSEKLAIICRFDILIS